MNWKNIIQSIASRGLTQSEIALAIGVKQSTIAGVLSGAHKDMRWRNGQKLLNLHERLTGRRVLWEDPDDCLRGPHPKHADESEFPDEKKARGGGELDPSGTRTSFGLTGA